jgi:FkbM family methyltransferase
MVGNWFSRYDRFYEIVKAQVPHDAAVLIVGANDGVTADPLYRIWRNTWHGYFIEPDPDARRRLAKNRRGTILPYAIGEGGTLTLHKMASEAARMYARKKKADGSCLTTIEREQIVVRLRRNLPELVAKHGIDDLIHTIDVECKTIPQLRGENLLPNDIDLAQIDAEGMDDVVALQCIGPVPVIMWEHQHLGAQRAGAVADAARYAGYIVEKLRNDTVAWRP